MKKLLLILICFLFVSKIKAQYVTIPDAKFAAYLQSIIPAAMNGNQMDTTNTAVTTLTRIYVENDSIGDLTGIQYFDSLKTLDCGNGKYAVAPTNYLTSLPKLPSALDSLVCGNNKITNLPILPNTLKTLKCYQNPLHNLPALPNPLLYLDCSFDSLVNLPVLPNTLIYLDCSFNKIANLPLLPNSIDTLTCRNNLLASLPSLPTSLRSLDCQINQLTNLPTLPTLLGILSCNNNQLINLPLLPTNLNYLNCYVNQLTVIPILPNSLVLLRCDNNQLTNLPTLPINLAFLGCSNNNILCFPILPNTLDGIYNYQQGTGFDCNLSNNPFTCLPNYVSAMDAATLAYPLCVTGNTNNCPASQGIFGYAYKDMNSNCMRNAGDTNLKNISIQLYDAVNNLLGQTYSALNGVYDFPQTMGTYTVVIDTMGSVPFTAQCNNLGLDSTVTVANIDTNVNFSLTCKPGFDVGVLSTVTYGLAFPGQQFVLNTIAGDISQWYNLTCATGISGQVQITVTGPVTYFGAAPGALTPVVGGNVYTYNIADFGAVNIMTAFNMAFDINTTAQAGNLVCINIAVTPTAGDNNVSNNNYSYCFPIENSHDPNLKETYPVNVLPGYNDWFTYTIHFQNTGTAIALNINLVDTLDTNLNLSTFQVINYSNKNTASVNGNVLSFNFPNINLPDSVSNPLGSIGFVQYRIKPKANLPNGTKIKNTANIYFDYNPAIVTNTTVNTFTTSTTGIKEIAAKNNLMVYPNPANSNITISSLTEFGIITIYNALGEIVLKQNSNNKQEKINISALPQGVYFIKTQQGTQKFIKE
ncbi:MAG: T9SS type A sorting domain-containing protein [Bacteroidia bacterium]